MIILLKKKIQLKKNHKLSNVAPFEGNLTSCIFQI